MTHDIDDEWRNSPLRGVVAIFVIAMLANVVIGAWLDNRDKPDIDPLSAFRDAIAHGPTRLTIVNASGCGKPFRHEIEGADLHGFLPLARKADHHHVPGHSSRLYEATLTLHLAVGVQVYDAFVSDQKPKDLFLRRTLDTRDREGRARHWIYSEIRIPGGRDWIESAAPEGATP